MLGGQTPRVIFIVGWGRSGSTLLGNALAELRGCVHVGEIHDLWSAFVRRSGCGCGRPLSECPFWKKVASSDPVVRHTLLSTPDEAHRMKQNYMRIRFIRRILTKSTGSEDYQSHLQAYADLYCRLLRSVASAADSINVVDSTKSPAAAALLLRVPLNASFVHLVRDPRATGFSWRRRKASDLAGTRQMTRLGYARNAGYWIYWNAIAELIKWRVSRGDWLRVRYEDFAADPEVVLRRIAVKFQLPTERWPLQGRVLNLGEHHTVEGNPSRFGTGPRPVVDDDEWRGGMPSAARILTLAITAPLLIAYGYHKRRRPSVGAGDA